MQTWRANCLIPRGRLWRVGPIHWGIVHIALGVSVAVTYFFAAQLSLVLLTKPDGVAVFWPAAGIAAGTLIALGPKVRLPIVIGVATASSLASLVGDRSIPATIVFAICNVGEPLLVAWLIQRGYGNRFRLESLSSVIGFFAAAAIGPVLSGAVATVGFILFYSSAAPVLTTWLNWFASDALGIVMVAPLLIGLSNLRQEFPGKWELVTGVLTLAALILVAAAAFGSPTHYWYTGLPLGMLLPALLAAYCRPVFAAAASLILGYAVVWATTFGVGEFGEPATLHDRAYAGRATLLAISACTLVLAALFAERRNALAALRDSNDRLADGLAAGEVLAFEWNAITRQSRYSNNANLILGDAQKGRLPKNEFFTRIHPDDRERVKGCIRGLHPENASYTLSFRFCCADGRQLWLEERARARFDTSGRLLHIKGLTRDITERKKAELALAERTLQLALARKAALVGSFAYDTDTELMQISEGYSAIHGFPDGTTEIDRSVCLRGVHPDDISRLNSARSKAFDQGQPEYQLEYRIICPGGEMRWVETRCFISFDNKERPRRVVGVSIDVTERKRTEEHQYALNAELDHRVKNVLATVSAIIAQTQPRGTLADYAAGLDSRIKSLARTHELLSHSQWHGVLLEEIARRELAPYVTDNAEISGLPVLLKAEAAQAIAMVLHELATNAAKYGAFSKLDGRLSLRWRWLRNGSHGRLAIEWQEIGGPPVVTPSRLGYGTSLIRELIPFELSGSANLEFASGGVRCRLEIPADWIRRVDRPGHDSRDVDPAKAVPQD